MAETMYSAPGVGLAATQVDVHQQIIVIDVSEDHSDLRVFINPEITRREGVAVNQEGCLSVPGIYDNVERAESVTVTALDRNGARFTLNASGMLATCIQHEMDHLQGKVFVELPLGPQAEPHPRQAQEASAQGGLISAMRPCA